MKSKKPKDSEGEARALTTYTLSLDDAQMQMLREECERRSWEAFEPEHTRFAFKGPRVTVTAYKSGKVVVSGKGTEEFVVHVIEPTITGEPRLGYDDVLHPEWFESHAGLDESGKGDFFGPVVTACVIADRPMIERWIKAGIRDSKRVSDIPILKLDKLIRETPGVAVATCYCGMAKYNELMGRPGANLNQLLAWQHARGLEEAYAKKPVAWGMLDQFSKQPLVQRRLKIKGFELKMKTRAEEDPVVAAASVVARAEFVRQIEKLSRDAGEPLEKGAGPGVREQAARLLEKHGAAALARFAKLHFRTAYEVVSAAGRLDELPLSPPAPKGDFRYRS